MSGIEVVGLVLGAFPIVVQLAQWGYDAAAKTQNFIQYHEGLKAVARDLQIQWLLFRGGYNKLRKIAPVFREISIPDASAPGSNAWLQEIHAVESHLIAESEWDSIIDVIKGILLELRKFEKIFREVGARSSTRQAWNRLSFVLAKDKRESELRHIQCLVRVFRDLVEDQTAEFETNTHYRILKPGISDTSAWKTYKDDIGNFCQTLSRNWGCRCGHHTISMQLSQFGMGFDTLNGFYILCANSTKDVLATANKSLRPIEAAIDIDRQRDDRSLGQGNYRQNLQTAMNQLNLNSSARNSGQLRNRLRHKTGSIARVSVSASVPNSSSWLGQSLLVHIEDKTMTYDTELHRGSENIRLCEIFQQWTSTSLIHDRKVCLEHTNRKYSLSAEATILYPLRPMSLSEALARPEDEGRTLFYERSKLQVGLRIASSTFWLVSNPPSFPSIVDVKSILFYPNIETGAFDWDALLRPYVAASHINSSHEGYLTMRAALFSLGATLYQLLENRLLDRDIFETPNVAILMATLQLDRYMPPWTSILQHCFYPERHYISDVKLTEPGIDFDFFVRYIYSNIISPLAEAVAIVEKNALEQIT